jgi:hypothetical protein
MGHIFISYSRKDTPVVNRLISELTKAGHHVWVDRADIKGGEQWRRQIVAAIESSDVFLLILSPHSGGSDNVRKELDLAEGAKRRVFPVIVKPTAIPEQMKYQLAGLQWFELASDFEAGLSELLKAVEGLSRLEPEEPALPPTPRHGSQVAIMAAVLAAVAVLLTLAVVVFIVLTSLNRDKMAPITPDRIAEAMTTPEQSSTPRPSEDMEATMAFKVAIETALAQTRQAELPAPTNTPAPPTDTPRAPTDTPIPPTDTPRPPTDTPAPSPTPTESKPSSTPKTNQDLIVEDFEDLSGRLEEVFEINRNAGNEGQLSLVGIPHVGHGQHALAFEFDIRNSPPNHYIGFDRAWPPQDWSNYASLCFWIESDSSDRSLVVQFGESKFKFWKKTYPLLNGTNDYCISLNDPHQLNLRAIGYYGVYVEGPPAGHGIIYIDYIRLTK